jgi:uncharacterized protein (DUF1501 family)
MKRESQPDDQGLPSRRQFMGQAACAAVGATAMVSTIWDLRFINAAAAASLKPVPPGTGNLGVDDYRALVCIFLYGGNDANNLLVPTDATSYAAYAAARQSLAIPQASLLPITPLTSDGRSYGLHPGCPELRDLFAQGRLAVMCNTGTLVAPITRAEYLAKSVARPPQLFSHNDQQVQWQTSVPDQPARTGWGGRCADLLHSLNGNQNVSMSISLAGQNTWEVGNVINQYNVSTTGAPSLSGTTLANPPSPSSAAQIQVIRDLINLQHANLYEATYADVTRRALDNAVLLNQAIAPTAAASYWTTPFPTSSLGNQLRMIARLIQARNSLGPKRQIFFASAGGYDLHSIQVDAANAAIGSHAGLLADLSRSMNAFYRATVQMGVGPNVTSFTASDFGRTFPVNNTTGSDHGWGSHQLVMGGSVIGQNLYGRFPTLAVDGPDDTSTGRWIPTTSVDEFSATMAKWFGAGQSDVRTIFPNIGRFANPDLGFLTA